MSVLAWHAPSIDESKAVALAAAMRIRPLTARLLVARGIAEADLAARFLAPRLADLRPPDGVADLPRAIERLTAALAAGEIIGVFGDYDVDGVTTAAILTSATVFFVTLAMNILGVGVIRDFAFAMNVGVIVGTYSSIFIASPVLIWLNDKYTANQRKQQNRQARRPQRDEGEPEGV